MKRVYVLLLGVLAAVSLSALAGAQASAGSARAARVAKVQLRRTSLGKLFVSGSGFTLYTFSTDHRNKNTCIMVSGCPRIWPALTTSGRPTGGTGVKASLLSTIRLPNGSKQVTYAGHPLYLYRESTEPGETSYVGAMQFGGTWDAINAAGHSVK